MKIREKTGTQTRLNARIGKYGNLCLHSLFLKKSKP